MKLKYTGKTPMVSKGISWVTGAEIEVSEEIGNYLLKTFKVSFEDVSPKVAKKAPAKRKPKEVKDSE